MFSTFLRGTVSLAILAMSLPAAATIPDWIQTELKIFRGAKNARDYVEKSSVIVRTDRAAILSFVTAEMKLPELTVEETPGLRSRSGNLNVEVVSSARRALIVNGKPYTVPEGARLPTVALDLLLRSKPTKTASLIDLLFPVASAKDKGADINNSCVWRLEQYMREIRDPVTFMDSPAWILPPLYIASIVLSMHRLIPAPNLFACDYQIQRSRDALSRAGVALSGFECERDYAFPTSVTFWIPKVNAKKKLRTRRLELDLPRGYAYEEDLTGTEDADDEEDGDDAEVSDPDLVNVKPGKPRVDRLYIFSYFPKDITGRVNLESVINMASQDGKDKCVPVAPESPEFAKVKGEMEPIKEFIHLITVFKSCHTCEARFRRELVSKTAPIQMRKTALRELARERAAGHDPKSVEADR